MRLSRSESVVQRGKDQKFRNKFKGKKKHKKLDSICEKAYTKSHGGAEKAESSELNNGGNELELRRSSRARKAPVLLDSSPMPPKKRRRVDRNMTSGVDKVRRGDRAHCETPCSSSRDLDEQIGSWVPRLRSRGMGAGFSRRHRGESSDKGKRKLFDDHDGSKDEVELQSYKNKEASVGEKSTIVKSKRPGRIKASNVLENQDEGIDLGDRLDSGEEKSRNEGIEVMDDEDGLQLEVELKFENAVAGIKGRVASAQDEVEECELERDSDAVELEVCYVAVQLDENNKTAVQRDPGLGECDTNGNVETIEDCTVQEDFASDALPDQGNAAGVDCATADQAKEDRVHHDKPPEDETIDNHREDETSNKSKGNYNVLDVADRKPRIKLGRRCGLCGGGTDGKPPKILVVEGTGSDSEAYSGSSASEEPNYDVWDGFGDQSGWLGRLLGPINDRFGIAGIWVHQQCAVWSPEVYFAGLGRLKNVKAALYRGRVLKCSRCRRPGATIGCRVDRCPKTYHLPCARAKNCIFDHRKFLIACTDHRRLFQPCGVQYAQHLKKMKAKKLKLGLRKMANDASRKDIEAEEKWLENCGEDEEFLKREGKRLQRDLWRIAPTYIGGENSEREKQFQGWESVAGLQNVIQCMKEVVILPLLYPEFFSNIGLTPPRGVLLHGFPGTGKTLVVRALVGSCARGDRRIAYFARKGADCLGKYVGDAERQLRLLFQVAEKSQPSIIFFDEIDGLAPCRTKQQDQTHNSVVSTLLALMDGLKSRGSVIVIGATNRPDAVDPALRRPGRFDREIYFPLPSVKDREAILSLHTQKWPKPVAGSLLKWMAQKTVGFAGADLQALCTQAAIVSLRRNFPLQEVLSAAESKAVDSNCPAIPAFSVEERDWLKALSCAPPPCSRRESGIALNDVVSSPLEIHLVPCLLVPLVRLLVCLYLDERVWLPSPLKKACSLVKEIIVSALGRRSVQSDSWWLHLDDLLQEMDVTNEIEKRMLHANVLFGERDHYASNLIGENADEGCSNTIPSRSVRTSARPGLLRDMSYGFSDGSGFQVLIGGSPRSGQRHLASCLLHYYVGNIDVWKIDLASISHEGHGDMIHGLTHILMRCASSSLCMLYMPMVDLWAVEAHDEISEDGCETTSMKPQSSDCHGEVEKENGFCPSAGAAGSEAPQSQPTAKKATYIWTSFIEQVESMRVNTSLIILATSELPLSSLPIRIRQFFGHETSNCSLLTPLNHKVPRFSVQLDGKFNHDRVIRSFASKLTKDMAQHFVQSIRGGIHNPENSGKADDMDRIVKGDADRSHNMNPSPVSPTTQVSLSNKKTPKEKSNLLLAISTFGHQILCYPHFAELCWVTSKLKEGPSANTSGPWKGWPFNSCIVHPIDSPDKAAVPSGSSNIKTKEFGLVRGLVAVGLSAYRGEYTSLRVVCSEVRKVLEALVRRIDDKIQAGKNRSLFVRILSQVAYLEDIVINWAHALHSLEDDTRVEANSDICLVPTDNDIRKDGSSEGDCCKPEVPDLNVDEEVCEKNHREVFVENSDSPTDVDKGCADASDEVRVTADEPSVPDKDTLTLDKVHVESSNATDNPALGSVKLSNGFIECREQLNNPPLTDNCASPKDSGENTTFTPDGLASRPTAVCFYKCCAECFVNLYNIVVRIINAEWELKGCDSGIEDAHDFVASLSANLHLSLSKFFLGENSRGLMKKDSGEYRNRCQCLKIQQKDTSECQDHEKLLNCNCHAASKRKAARKISQISQGFDSRFVFKDGVLTTLDTDDAGTADASFHCKFEKLCLCFLVEWLSRSKGVS
ncbi:P-loop containing nucleoside triphosphate hydrolases superfamily protein [Striga hermonthica]|uniref:P-loop containing nucleoside triphosphate hydrolases superfamily protein n=1 Tax=Striga hermonthica TaxID=68872 RepID=A0A9N7R7Q6_STRHE|nr:P-loop containing nucleoside triphosphate hydrolases superfamily protein [Striga hermonthica]